MLFFSRFDSFACHMVNLVGQALRDRIHFSLYIHCMRAYEIADQTSIHVNGNMLGARIKECVCVKLNQMRAFQLETDYRKILYGMKCVAEAVVVGQRNPDFSIFLMIMVE